MLNEFISPFHFIEPLWLLGLIPVALIIWQLLKYRRTRQSAWKRIIDHRFLPFLQVRTNSGQHTGLPVLMLALAWILAVIALANPTWKNLPQPVFQHLDAQVIVLNLSPAMLVKDIKPSRLLQAKYKIEDILDLSQGKQSGLIVYSGDAFTVTPLTDDISTIKSQLRVLEPSLMPTSGNRPDRALQQAGKLLAQAGYLQGHIILITANSGNTNTLSTAEKLAQQGYRVSILGIGTANGAPIPGVRDNQGKPVISRIDRSNLENIAQAGHGIYTPFTSSLDDVRQILTVDQVSETSPYQDKTKHQQAKRWVQEGPWLTVLLLPLSLLIFRRGWFLILPFMLVLPLLNPQPAMASRWDDLWQRPDQQAAKAFTRKEYKNAASLATDPDMQGSALYRAGNYKQAIKYFSQKNDVNSAYNLGNALAHTGDYKKALEAYDRVLKKQPQMKDAIENRKLVAELLKQQQQQQQQQKSEHDKPQNKKQDNKQDKNQDKNQQRDKGNQTASDQQAQSKNNDATKSPDHDRNGNKKNTPSQQQKQADNNQNADNKKPASDTRQNNNTDQDSKNQHSKQQDSKDLNAKGQDSKTENMNNSSESNNDKKHSQEQAQQNRFTGADSENQQKYADRTVKEATAKKQPSKKVKKHNNKPESVSAPERVSQDKLSPEERQSVENWLRRVPDDPGGLLRRKFLYQYQQRQQR